MAVPSNSGGSSGQAPGPYQIQLENHCAAHGMRAPVYMAISDRRGGRTAWSYRVNIEGQQYQARLWYDGPHAERAKEDVAQLVLEQTGVVRSSGISPLAQSYQPVQPGQQGQQAQQGQQGQQGPHGQQGQQGQQVQQGQQGQQQAPPANNRYTR